MLLCFSATAASAHPSADAPPLPPFTADILLPSVPSLPSTSALLPPLPPTTLTKIYY